MVVNTSREGNLIVSIRRRAPARTGIAPGGRWGVATCTAPGLLTNRGGLIVPYGSFAVCPASHIVGLPRGLDSRSELRTFIGRELELRSSK